MEISLAIIALISIATYFNKFISTFLIACTCACLIFFINLFIFILFLAVLGLRCCARAFSTCHAGLLFRCRAQAFRRGGFSCCGAQALDTQAQ